MAAEYEAQTQSVLLNSPVVFYDSIPCNRGIIYHANGSGIFLLRGITNQCYATFQVTFNGNIALPEGATVGPIALAIVVNGEPKQTSRAIFTPAAVEEYGNVTCTAIIKVPRGCCFSVAIENVAASADPAATPAPVLSLEDGNLVISRIA